VTIYDWRHGSSVGEAHSLRKTNVFHTHTNHTNHGAGSESALVSPLHICAYLCIYLCISIRIIPSQLGPGSSSYAPRAGLVWQAWTEWETCDRSWKLSRGSETLHRAAFGMLWRFAGSWQASKNPGCGLSVYIYIFRHITIHPVYVCARNMCNMNIYVYIYTRTSSTAQGGGGSFKNRKPIGKLIVVTHGWQSESTDGPKGGWSCVFWSGCNGCSGHLTTTAGCSVV